MRKIAFCFSLITCQLLFGQVDLSVKLGIGKLLPAPGKGKDAYVYTSLPPAAPYPALHIEFSKQNIVYNFNLFSGFAFIPHIF
jgi:hypothetical protein